MATALILVSQFSFMPVQDAQAAEWTPASLGSSLGLWLDASDATSITSSGGLVSQWNDKSGNARHAVQTSSSSQPTLNGAGISISDYSRFMTGAMAVSSFPTSIQVTVVFTASGGGRNGYQSHPFTRTTNNYPTPYDGYNDTLLVGGPTGSYAGFGGYADMRSLTTRTVLSTSMSATKVEQYLNGTLRKTDSGNYPYRDVPSIFYVGTRADRYTHFTGEINEIVVTNQLSTSDRVSLESYLGAKWAVSGIPTPPANSLAPSVTGTARTGETLTTSNGTWTGVPTSYSYQWQRASTVGGTYSNIASAVNNTYVLTDADIGKYIKVAVIATNSIGASTAALSAATSIVLDLPDSVVPTVTTPVATAAGFTFTISNYSSLYTYVLTTSKGTVSRSTDGVTVTGLTAGESATVTIAVTRTSYKPASKTVTGSAIPAPTTTTTVAPALSIVIQAPVTTVAQGQGSVATLAPTTTTIPVLGTNGAPVPTTTTVKPKTIVTTTLPAIVTTTTVGPPVVEKVAAGQTAVQVDGVKTDATVTRENNQMVVTSGSLSATLSGLDKAGKTAPLDSDGNIHLEGGDVIKISVGGFKPKTLVEVWLFSTPTKLGSVVVGTDGTVTGAYRLPVGIKSGSHRVVVTAKLPNGKPTTFTLGILVGNISKSSTLTRVLIAIPITLAIGFGFLLPTQLRHRRRKKYSRA